MQEDKIRLPNRYNEEVYLEKIAGNIYKLIMSKNLIYRVGFGKNNEYNFIDPHGGPFIEVGGDLPVGKVKSIIMFNDDYIIEVE